jgi:hypothetical protein
MALVFSNVPIAVRLVEDAPLCWRQPYRVFEALENSKAIL